MITKPKYTTILIDSEDSPCPALSSTQPRLNSLGKNR